MGPLCCEGLALSSCPFASKILSPDNRDFACVFFLQGGPLSPIVINGLWGYRIIGPSYSNFEWLYKWVNGGYFTLLIGVILWPVYNWCFCAHLATPPEEKFQTSKLRRLPRGGSQKKMSKIHRVTGLPGCITTPPFSWRKNWGYETWVAWFP